MQNPRSRGVRVKSACINLGAGGGAGESEGCRRGTGSSSCAPCRLVPCPLLLMPPRNPPKSRCSSYQQEQSVPPPLRLPPCCYAHTRFLPHPRDKERRANRSLVRFSKSSNSSSPACVRVRLRVWYQ
jgi:hypothetical protein